MSYVYTYKGCMAQRSGDVASCTGWILLSRDVERTSHAHWAGCQAGGNQANWPLRR